MEESSQLDAGFFNSCLKEEFMSNSNALKGAMMMTASNVAFCGMIWLIRYASYLNIQTTTLFRFIVGMGVIGVLAMTGRIKLAFVDKPGLFVRGLCGGIAVWMCFVSIAKLGLIKSSLIGYTYPVFATIFGVFMLKEKLGMAKICALTGACAGMAVIVLSTGKGHASMGFGFWEAFALCGAMLGGLTVVLIKKLQDTDTTESIFFSQCLVGFWLMVVPATAAPFTCGYAGCGILLAIGVLAAIGQLVMTEGYRHVSVASGSVITLLAPVLNVAVGSLLFREPFPPQAMAGAAVLLVSSVISVIGDAGKGVN
jgi:drug/metabolite transporter (DMT)-like permease